MSDQVIALINVIKMFYGDGVILFFTIISGVYLLCSKEIRGKLLFPILLIVICVFNPISYKVMSGKVVYWRLFWMVPNVLIISMAIVKFAETIKATYLKGLVIFVAAMTIAIFGKNVYTNSSFVRTQNIEKVSKDTEVICDIMLSTNPSPRCILPQTLFCEARQYSSNISMRYGRNVQYYISHPGLDQTLVYTHMEAENPYYDYVLNDAVDNLCNFIIVYKEKPIAQALLEQYGYEQIGQSEGYLVYYNKELKSPNK